MVPSLIVHTTLDTFYLIALNALFFLNMYKPHNSKISSTFAQP